MDEAIIYTFSQEVKTWIEIATSRTETFAIFLTKPSTDIILCLVDISEECLKQAKRNIPDTYRDTILV